MPPDQFERLARRLLREAAPIDLIDGERLCDLLKDYELGVRRTIRHVEEVDVLPEFFNEL